MRRASADTSSPDRRRRQGRALRRRLRARLNVLLVLVIIAAHASAIQMLMLIGQPAWHRVDDVWLHAHQGEVRLLLLDAAISLIATTLLLMPHIGRSWARVVGLTLWMCTVAAVARWWGPTVIIIARIVMREFW